MNTEPVLKCPQCGAPLPPNAPDGLCPKCLMEMNLKTETVFSGELVELKPPLPPEELAPHFPQLEILECLGRGGMGVVYKARQKSLNRLVALKLLAPERAGDPAFAARFEKEARALAALNHPNIVTIYDHGQAGGFYFLLMEFVDGVTLRQLLTKERVTAREALAIVPQICDALQFAHDQGIVHRDIKPENILLDRRGRVKVADFGLAKIVAAVCEDQNQGGGSLTPQTAAPENLTDAGKVMGTPQYMSPEQVQAPGEVDHRADIYALGVVFYQMLTGELPGKHIEPPSRKVHIDVRLDEIVMRALEQKPELRFQQASVLKTQLDSLAQSGVPATHNASEATSQFSKTAIAGLSWGLLHMAGIVVWGFNNWRLAVPGFISAALGSTILGWTSVVQIRRSAGKMHGLQVAVFAGLLFPILTLDIGIVALDLFGRTSSAPSTLPNVTVTMTTMPIPTALLLSAVIAIVDWFVIRFVWRAVNKASVPKAAHDQQMLGVTSWVGVGLVSLMAVFAIFFATWLGAVIVTRDQRAETQAEVTMERSARERLTSHAATLSGKSTFGPLLERVISETEASDQHLIFFDFESGNRLRPPFPLLLRSNQGPAFVELSTDLLNWVTAKRMDVLIQFTASGWNVMNFRTQDDYIAQAGDWDNVTADAVVSVFTAKDNAGVVRDEVPSSSFGHAFNDQRDTCKAFRTRSNTMGVMQWMGLKTEPRGIKIRYRMVQENQHDSALTYAVAKAVYSVAMTTNSNPLAARYTNGTYEQARKLVAAMDKTEERRNPFVVRGRVVDAEGNGLGGVTISANCGIGTLRRTGTAESRDDGSYELHFRPGMLFLQNGTPPANVQAATIYPAKPGYFDANLNRQGELLMGDRIPAPGEDVGWKVDTNKLVLPNVPYELNFVLLPAANISGTLCDDKGAPVTNYVVSFAGETLPPSSSVFRETYSDTSGRFQLDDLPTTGRWWLAARKRGNRREYRSKDFTLSKPGSYDFRVEWNPTNESGSLKILSELTPLSSTNSTP